jgi:hypothetical protein
MGPLNGLRLGPVADDMLYVCKISNDQNLSCYSARDKENDRIEILKYTLQVSSHGRAGCGLHQGLPRARARVCVCVKGNRHWAANVAVDS